MERIDKIIALNCGISRKQAIKLIKDGRVLVNGQTVTDKDLKIDIENTDISVDGEPIAVKKHIYIMLNKPKAVVSASEGRGEKTVVDLVPPALFRQGLFPAGRLDKDTTGFVLITDDGDFAHRILSPKNHIYKTYHARLSSPLSEESIERLKEGITLLDGTSLKGASVKILEDSEAPLAEISICEGKYHQVKRMFAASGSRVTELKRVKMGNLPLDFDLPEGECREITPEELLKITEK